MSILYNGVITAFIALTLLSKPSLSLLEHTHNTGEVMKIGMGPMTSVVTQLPFKYSYVSSCVPEKEISLNDNLGELLLGSTIYQSNYEIKINQNEYCKLLCNTTISPKSFMKYKWIIEHGYQINWYLDQLPTSKADFDPINNITTYEYNKGIDIGYQKSIENDDELILYNHYIFQISLHQTTEDAFEIVGFDTFPYSIEQKESKMCSEKESVLKHTKLTLPQPLNGNMLFTYDVIFVQSNLTMVTRWDHYRNINSEIHWFGLINSNLIIIIFTFLVIFIFCRALKKEIEIYNVKVTGEDFIDEFGWKQVCNDVFRKPVNNMLLSSLFGTGIQLFLMVFIGVFVGVIGILQPERRGNLLTLMILLYVFMGIIGGYASTRLYKTFHGTRWLMTSLLTAILYPSIVFVVFLCINIFFAFERSSAAISLTELLSLLMLWLCCSSPLVLIGAFIGIKQKTIKTPCRVNPFPNPIPNKPWFFRIKYLVILTGIFPFGAVFIEFLYIMASLWRYQIYFLFGFLWISLIVLIITSAEISIIVVYLCLCKGDYNWWWKCFFISGSPTIYIFGSSVFYFFNLNIVRVSSFFIYFGAMTLISSVIFLICGAMGLLITFFFLTRIYSMIKID